MDDDNIRLISSNTKPEGPVKTFLNKPMNQMTMGDALAMQAGTVAISVLVPMVVQGWMIIIQRTVQPRRNYT